MFKLQRLEITGFKSFADYTELAFTGDGITAIVGPNGCGKSNIAEAISWVLGEQRVKNLRSGEMKDVIFQGSRNRQPSGMAEVVLHLVRSEETPAADVEIEDIDATLEDIDEHAVIVEKEPSLAIIEAATAEIIDADAAQSDAGGQSPTLKAHDAQSEIIIAENSGSTALQTVVIDAEAGAQADEQEEKLKRSAHKRHWRPSRMALDFAPGETVSVARRLYRSGDSEYLLNNRTCRLRDIQDLFSGTGLSGAHYAIIEQGRIGQVLSAKPMDRRTLIEEAAGITKFRVRQRAAEARLEGARGNLNRVSDIIAEIERQVNSLRRQAAKARRYRIMREELRDLMRHTFVAEERSLTLLLSETATQLAAAQDTEQDLVARLTERESAARVATQKARDLEEQIAELRAAAAAAALQRDRHAREKIYQSEQVTALEKRRAEFAQENEILAERTARADEEIARLHAEESKLQIASTAEAAELKTAEEQYAARLSEVRAAETAIEAARAALLQHTAANERLQEIARQLDSALERLATQAEGFEREGERAQAVHAEKRAEAELLATEINVARARIETLRAERDAARQSVEAARTEVQSGEAILATARDEAARVHHRLATLREVEAKHANYSPVVQSLLNAREDFHIVAPLADKISVDARWEQTVEGALGAYLQALIVPTPQDALRAAEWLRANRLGRASFLIAGLHGASGESSPALSGKINPPPSLLNGDGATSDTPNFFELLNAPEALTAQLAKALPQLQNARIADDLETALTLSLSDGATYLSREGDWVAGGSLLQAGWAQAANDGAGLLSFKRELRELESQTEKLTTAVADAKQQLTAVRAALETAENALVDLNETVTRAERQLLSQDMQATQMQQEIERAERHLRVVREDAARLGQEQDELIQRRMSALQDATIAEEARAGAADAVAVSGATLNSTRARAEEESENLSRQRSAAAAAAERRRANANELRRMEHEKQDVAARADRIASESANIAEQLTALRTSLETLTGSTETAAEEEQHEAERIQSAAAEVAHARDAADNLTGEVSTLNQQRSEARETRGALEVQQAQAETRLNYVRETCLHELNQSLTDVARETALEEDFDLEVARARVEDLREKLENFGAVNMMALEELAEAEERFTFLTGQRADIIGGIGATEEALREIKRRSRERFRLAFDEINRHFSEFFLELFGGGRGEMNLIETADVLESGIDIVAQPPGKRLQNVLLLSGGEKAMAALALILAIFRYRPSPFCLLDEVDAPLDEANVGRFTEKVRQMSERTQFLVITHNKRTMEAARALYGVTMEEAGVSKLVSVQFE